MTRLRLAIAVATLALAGAGPAVSAPATGDRPAGSVSTWGHELNENELPSWRLATAPPIPPRRWYRTIDGILRESARTGSGSAGRAPCRSHRFR